MKTENNLSFNWLPGSLVSSAQFQQYIGRSFWFKARSARIAMIPTEQNCGFGNPTTWNSHPQLLCFEPSASNNPKNPSPWQDFPCVHGKAASSSWVHSWAPRLSMTGEKQFPGSPLSPITGMQELFSWVFLSGFKFVPRNFIAASWAVSLEFLISHKMLISSKFYLYNSVQKTSVFIL